METQSLEQGPALHFPVVQRGTQPYLGGTTGAWDPAQVESVKPQEGGELGQPLEYGFPCQRDGQATPVSHSHKQYLSGQ